MSYCLSLNGTSPQTAEPAGKAEPQPVRGRAGARVRRRGEHGAEVVEFAFIFVLLSALMLAIISFARAYNVYESIVRAAREGARMAALPSSVYDGNTFLDGSNTYSTPTSPIFTNYIAPALQAANLNTAACANSRSTNCIANYNEQIGWVAASGTPDNQCAISISFSYPYKLIIPFLDKGFGTLNISTSVQMRRENQPTPGGSTCP